MSLTYYNEINKFAAKWLNNLWQSGSISPGIVDTRSIVDVSPIELREYNRVHLFAGIGGWDYALRLAGWPDSQPVWSGSCPCQPFSLAGKQHGVQDERHLWPEMFRLIDVCRPPTIMGEQVASKGGLMWLDEVYTDLENAGYSVWACDTCAASVGAPHIRQRLFWVADTYSERFAITTRGAGQAKSTRREITDTDFFGRRLPNWLSEPLMGRVVDGISAVPHAVRAYGNAIVPQVAAGFISAYMQYRGIQQ